MFLAHVLDVVGKQLKKFGEMAWDEWRSSFHAIMSIYCRKFFLWSIVVDFIQIV